MTLLSELYNNRMHQTAPLGRRASSGVADTAAGCAFAHRRRC
jgi:hypothetical protein